MPLRNLYPREESYAEQVRKRPAPQNDNKQMETNPSNRDDPNIARLHGNINPRDVSFSTAVQQEQRSSPRGQPTVASSEIHAGMPNSASFGRFNRKRPTVSIVGDSIIKGIRKQEINRSVRQMNTFVKTFQVQLPMIWNLISSQH